LGFAVQNSAFAETPLRGYQNQTTNYEKKDQPFLKAGQISNW
jgi:hypothetical protein